MNLTETFGTDRPVVGMVHLQPLPGAPRFDGDLDAVRERAVRDAEALAAGGVDAVMVENFGDAPFYPDDVPKHVVAHLTAMAGAVADAVDLPVGINVLRNDGEAALSVADAVGADFVRVNVHAGARVTDQGVVEGQAHETMRLRERLSSSPAVLADLDVKHSAPLGQGEYGTEAFSEASERGLADGVVVSGTMTGAEVDREYLEAVAGEREAHGVDTPVFVGSGVTAETVGDLLAYADGVVVGTALKEGGETTNPVDRERVAQLVAAARE